MKNKGRYYISKTSAVHHLKETNLIEDIFIENTRAWKAFWPGTNLRSVDVHFVERVDGDEDVAHVGVDLIPAVALLELLADRILPKKQTNKQNNKKGKRETYT